MPEKVPAAPAADIAAQAAPPTDAAPAAAVRQYGEVAPIYDALMAGVPHAEWLRRIEQAVRERGKAPRSVLDVACGTGLASEWLVEHGYAPVVGVDLSASMIAVARTKALARGWEPSRLRYVCQDAAALDLDGPRFDLAVSLFDSLNYILDPHALRQALRRVFAHLTPGGVFAFDLNAMYALSHDLFTQTGTYGPVHHVWKAYWDQATRICRVEMNFWVRDPAQEGGGRFFTETHLQRAYTVTEITDWLAEVGFVNVDVFGNYGKRPPGPKSDRLLFVTERPA